MRFKCLVMDHDDTTVNSTATIHFPSFLAYLKLVRPEASYTLEEYFRKNFDPGIMALFTGELGFSEEEIEGEFRFWQDWVRTRIPVAYPGIREILQRHKEAGGRIAVVSHSMRENIERDYRENDLPERIRNQFQPLFDPAAEQLSPEILRINDFIHAHAGYSLRPAQLAVAESVKRKLSEGKSAFIVAECGSGKTKIGAAALAAYQAQK